MRALRLLSGEATWTVVDSQGLPIEPIEDWLDHLRLVRRHSPNTVKAYAYGLAAWWDFLDGKAIDDWHNPRWELIGQFINWLETGSAPESTRPSRRQALAEGMVYNRVKAVTSYAFWEGESSFSAPATPFLGDETLSADVGAHQARGPALGGRLATRPAEIAVGAAARAVGGDLERQRRMGR